MGRMIYGKRSIKTWLIAALLAVSVVPILFVNIVSYFNTSSLVRSHIDNMIQANLKQTQISLDVWLESYEDILYQVYTDDSIVDLADKINNGEDVANSRKMLRRILRGLAYTKDYVKSIMVITDSGEAAFYDQFTASSTYTSWMDSIPMSQEELYGEISGDGVTHLFSTGDQVEFGSSSCFFFHIGHRLIDYRNINKQCGVVLVSIDEKLLRDICASPTEGGFNFIVDGMGRVVTCTSEPEIGTVIFSASASEEERQAAYQALAGRISGLEGRSFSICSVFDEKTGWSVVRATDQEELLQILRQQQQWVIMVTVLSLLAVLAVIVSQVSAMTGSIQRVVEAMRKAGKGDLGIHVPPDEKRPAEIEIIAEGFNQTMDKLKQSVERQRQAEITALEAQINPHFLYNTLDTINWMAIDKDEYEISNAITSLAHILRYGISNSNAVVRIRDEADWLKQYIFLQQTRLKNAFACQMDIAPETMDMPIHKLLLQPFIENAILHGFDGVSCAHRLRVRIYWEEGWLKIEIEDNGRGIRDDIVREMNGGLFRQTENKNHIGMENAITRIRMYYGESAQVLIESELGQGTTIHIRIPLSGGSEGV